MKKVLTILILFLGLSNYAFAKENINIYLFYASWNANSQKALNVTQNVANTYKKNVGYKAFDVDADETYKFVKNSNIQIPKIIPSVIVVDKHQKIINTMPYRNQDESKLKNVLDNDVLPNI